MSYFPLYFPCYAYHRDHPRGFRFETPADFARIDDGAWVDTPAKLTVPEPEPEPEPETGLSDDERMQREPEPFDFEAAEKRDIIAAFGLDVPDHRKVTKAKLIELAKAKGA